MILGVRALNVAVSSVSLLVLGSINWVICTLSSICGVIRALSSIHSLNYTDIIERGDANLIPFISDLQTRKTTREDAWKVDGWSETVYKTGTYT